MKQTQTGPAGAPFGAERFVEALRAAGFDFFAGVPCSLVKNTIARLVEEDGRGGPRYIDATREDNAVALAVGAAMAGRRPCVLMQNSGLGTSLNSLTSLAVLYRLPMLLVVTWRGEGGRDSPEHLIMGEVCGEVMETARVPHRTPAGASLAADLAWAAETSAGESRPVALLLSKGVVE